MMNEVGMRLVQRGGGVGYRAAASDTVLVTCYLQKRCPHDAPILLPTDP